MYAVVHVSDSERSEAFYTSLIGWPPDDRPMAGLIQWRGVAGGNLQLVEDPDKAGASALDARDPRHGPRASRPSRRRDRCRSGQLG